MDAYTLKADKNTGELHLFKGKFSDNACTSATQSLCQGMVKSDSERNLFTCLNEDDARKKCAEIGRSVCGVCVSTLYTTY